MAGLGGMVPPVVFYVEAKADKAIASFAAINKELTVMELKAGKAGAAITRFNQAALIGTKVLKGFAAGFVIASAIGVKAIMDIEKSYAALGQAMANQGLATEANLQATSELVDSYEKLGFGSEKAADAYKVLITATGDVTKSNNLLKTSADLARAGHMSIEDAARALVRAQNGNIKLFTQFGITLDQTKPKAIAVADAMAQLEAKLGGQAQAYTKTFAGQLEVMKESFGDIFEAIGMRVLPILNLFLAKINGAGKFIRDYKKEIEAAATALTVLLIPAMINFTKKLVVMSAAMLKSPLVRTVALVYGIAYAFNRASGEASSFAKIFGGVADWFLATVGTMVNGIENLVQPLMYFTKAGIMARKALADIRGDKEASLAAQKELNQWEKEYRAIDQWSTSIEHARQKVRDFQSGYKGFNLDFGMPKIQDFFTGGNGTITGITDDLTGLSDALINAAQRAKDFKQSMDDALAEIANSTNTLVGKDTKEAIRVGLLDPVDQMVLKADNLVNTLNKAKEDYTGAMTGLTKAQLDYAKAVSGTDKALIASAESALKRAETMATDVLATQKKTLDDLIALQDQAISEIVASYQKIDQLKTDRANAIAQGNEDQAQATKEHLKNLANLQKDYDKQVLSAQQDAAKRTAEIVKQSVDQLRGIYRSATQKSIGDIYSGLTFQGKYLSGGSLSAITDALGLQLKKANALADDAAQLSGLGFTQTFIEQVVSQGADVGHALTQEIVKSTPDAIKDLQKTWSELERVSQHGVDTTAEKLNSGITLATEELTASLAQVGKDLQLQLAEYLTAFNQSVADEATAYADAISKIQVATNKVVADIDASIATLTAKITSLQALLAQIAALQTSVNTAQTQPKSVTGSIVPIPLYQYNSLSQGKVVTTPFDTGVSSTKTITINQANYTNASPQSIADSTAWAVRTSSDISYTPSSAISAQKAKQLESMMF